MTRIELTFKYPIYLHHTRAINTVSKFSGIDLQTLAKTFEHREFLIRQKASNLPLELVHGHAA